MSHLMSFAVVSPVVVLCICVVSSFTVSTNVSNKTSEAALDHKGSADSDSTTSSITFTPVSVNFITSPNTHPLPTSNTHADHYGIKATDTDHSKGSSLGSTTTGPTTTTGSTTMRSTSTTGIASTGLETNDAGKSVGIVFLIFIFFIIIVLAMIVYVLWKKGKRYSFDLTNCEHDTPLQSIEQAGSFEPTKGSTINLDYIPEENSNRTSPVPNGCSGAMPEKTLCSEQRRVSEDDSSGSDLSLNSPVKKVEFNLDLELIGADPEVEKGTLDEPVDNGNESNNNNDTNAGSGSAELFTEINLDDVQ